MYRTILKALAPRPFLQKALYKNVVRVPHRCFAFKPAEERYSNMVKPYENFLPNDGPAYRTNVIETSEVEVRILSVLRHFEKIDLKSITFTENFKKDFKLDSLETIALLTSIEHEFNTVFEDRVFDNLQDLEQVVKHLTSDLNTI